MAGEQVPLVLLPRYTSYVGATTFTTIALDVTNYSKATISAWRGPLVGTSATIGFTFEESMDGVTWSTCSGVTAGVDPGSDTEAQYTPTLSRKFFRVKVTLGGTDPAGSVYAIGFLELRER